MLCIIIMENVAFSQEERAGGRQVEAVIENRITVSLRFEIRKKEDEI